MVHSLFLSIILIHSSGKVNRFLKFPLRKFARTNGLKFRIFSYAGQKVARPCRADIFAQESILKSKLFRVLFCANVSHHKVM